jgi:hypothetical protein
VETPAQISAPAKAEEPYTKAPPPGLPNEARAYFETLSRAFAAADGDFLLSQGEAMFEAQIRPRYDEETYFALLYRAGPLASQSPPEASGRLPRLNYRDIRGIEYAGWGAEDPFISVRARLLLQNGTRLPCEIVLAWKLLEPKILGVFP